MVHDHVPPFPGCVIQYLELRSFTCQVTDVPLDVPECARVGACRRADGLAVHEQLHGRSRLDTERMIAASDEKVDEVPVKGEGR
jgi:hypothetical protein